MRIGFASLILATLLPIAIAQGTGSVEGSVDNRITHRPIAGAIVSVDARQTVADPSGAFRFAGLKLGDHTCSVEAAGFFKLTTPLHLGSAIAPAHLDLELIPHSAIFGRVLDEDGNPVPGADVQITQAIRGTGTTWTISGATTDREGRYRVDGLEPGAYLAMALPVRGVHEGDRRASVRTYFPSVSDRGAAGRLVLRGGSELPADIRLLSVPVYAIRGVVYDDGGKPANATVSLLPFDPLEERYNPLGQVATHNGMFEFPRVPAGDWRVVAESNAGEIVLRGAGPAALDRHEIDNLTLRLAAPFALRALVEPAGKVDSPAIELYPTDAPPSLAAYSQSDPDNILRFPAVYTGRYRIEVFRWPAGYYLDSVLAGEQDVLGKEVMLTEGMPPIRVVFKPSTAGLRGHVESCGDASILLLPRDEGLWDFRFIIRGSCDGSGHFEIGGVRPGDYYALALDRIDSTGLDDLDMLRRLADMGKKVQVESGRSAYLELTLTSWPE